MNKSLITIVTSAYNAERTIERAINSVLNQNYTNIEYIVVDHGSRDNTYKILDRYRKKDNRIKVLQMKHNTGYIGKAMNYGLDHAKGEYICFLDADDAYELDFIEVMYLAVIEAKAEVAISGYRPISQESGEQLDDDTILSYAIIAGQKEYKENSIQRIKNGYKNNTILDVWWNKIYRVKYLIDNNIRFYEDKLLYGDAWFNRKIFEDYPKVVMIPYVGYNFYQSTTSTRKYYRHDMYKEMLEYVELWLESNHQLYEDDIDNEKETYFLVIDASNQVHRVHSLDTTIKEMIKELGNWIEFPIFKKVVYLIQCQIEFLRNIELSIRMIEEKDRNLMIENPSSWLEEYISLDLDKEMDKCEKFEKLFSILFEEENYTSVGTQGLIDMIVQ